MELKDYHLNYEELFDYNQTELLNYDQNLKLLNNIYDIYNPYLEAINKFENNNKLYKILEHKNSKKIKNSKINACFDRIKNKIEDFKSTIKHEEEIEPPSQEENIKLIIEPIETNIEKKVLEEPKKTGNGMRLRSGKVLM